MPSRFIPSWLLAGPAAERAWRLVAFTLMAVVAGLALTPTPPPVADTGWDKLNHVLAFAALGACARLGFPGSLSWAALLATGLLAYGGAIELLQPMMGGGRVGDWGDLLADALGTAAGIACADLLRRMRGSRKADRAQAQAIGR